MYTGGGYYIPASLPSLDPGLKSSTFRGANSGGTWESGGAPTRLAVVVTILLCKIAFDRKYAQPIKTFATFGN